MPEPRAPRLAVAAVQFDPVDWRSADYRRSLRRAEAYAGHGLQPRRPTPRSGWAVEIRNGMPEPSYRWHARCPGCPRCGEHRHGGDCDD